MQLQVPYVCFSAHVQNLIKTATPGLKWSESSFLLPQEHSWGSRFFCYSVFLLFCILLFCAAAKDAVTKRHHLRPLSMTTAILLPFAFGYLNANVNTEQKQRMFKCYSKSTFHLWTQSHLKDNPLGYPFKEYWCAYNPPLFFLLKFLSSESER